jgi:hypothetical protein
MAAGAASSGAPAQEDGGELRSGVLDLLLASNCSERAAARVLGLVILWDKIRLI